MKKRWMGMFVLLTGLLLLIASCGGGGNKDESKGVTEIELWTLKDKKASMEKAVEDFNAKQDKIKVKASFYTIDTLKQNLKVAASSGTLPDIWFNYGGVQGEYYQTNGISYELDDYASQNNWSEKFDSGALKLATPNQSLIGYPISVNAIAMYYNKEIFSKYNLTAPTTLEELDKVCAVLKENGVTPLATGGKYGWHVMRYVEQFLEYYAGADLHDQLTALEASWDNEAVTKAFEKYKEYVDKGYFPEGFVTADPNDLKLVMYSGKTAMTLEGQWFEPVMVADEQDSTKFDCFYFPSGGNDRLSGFVEIFQLNKKLSDSKVDSAVEFLDSYFSTENVEANVSEFNLPVPQKGGYQIPDNLPIAKKVISGLDSNGVFTILDQAFPAEVADVLYSCQDAIANGTMQPKEVGPKIQAAVEAYKKAQ